MNKYFELLVERRKLQERVSKIKADELEEVILSIVDLMNMFSISIDQVKEVQLMVCKEAIEKKYNARYMDPHTGRTWSGRGRPPSWIAGKNFDDFLLPQNDLL